MTGEAKIGVYTLGTYSVANPTPSDQDLMVEEAVARSRPSDFNLVMLASLHVHDDGSIFFNDTPMINSESAGAFRPAQPQSASVLQDHHVEIRDARFIRRRRRVQRQSGRLLGFQRHQNVDRQVSPIPPRIRSSRILAFMFDIYPWIRGIDLDLECNSLADYQSFTTTLATIIKWLGAGKYACTLCPYQFPDFWVDVIKRAGGAGQITWVDLQNADDTAGEFVGPLKSAGIGVGQIVGGLQVGEGMQPHVTQEFATLVKQYPGSAAAGCGISKRSAPPTRRAMRRRFQKAWPAVERLRQDFRLAIARQVIEQHLRTIERLGEAGLPQLGRARRDS